MAVLVTELQTPEQNLLSRLEALLAQPAFSKHPEKRIIICLAGPPGSGKSTIAENLTKIFNSRHDEKILTIPMDGYHYPRSVLPSLRKPNGACPIRRRGAPFTFSPEPFISLIHSLSSTSVSNKDVSSSALYAPTFSHAEKDPVPDSIQIPSSQRIILVEGSYLLLDQKPWNQIKQLVTESWFISVPREVARERIVKRHLEAGIENDEQSAIDRVEGNDLLNWDLVNERFLGADLIVENL